MTIEQRIQKFIKKYPEPYQFKIELRWVRKDGMHSKTYFKNNESGRTKYWSGHFLTNTGRDFITQHYRYDEKLGLLELAYAVFDCHTPKKGENRRWKYGYRYFIPKGTRDLYDADGKQGKYWFSRATYDGYVYNPSSFAQQFSAIPYVRPQFENTFFKFAGDNVQTSGSYYSHMTTNSSPWQLSGWFSYVPKTKTTGKVQKSIDELSAREIVLPDKAKNKLISLMNEYGSCKKYAWFDLDNKVFRCFVESVDGIFEDKRVYLDAKGKPVVATISPNGEWVTNRSFTSSQFNFQIANLEDVFKLPYQDYLKKLVGNNTTVHRIVSAMKYPEIEQFVNMGLTRIADHIYKSDKIAYALESMFGKPNKKKSVLARYNINKKQAEYVNTKMDDIRNSGYYWYPSDSTNIVANIKKYMFIDNIASLDYDTFVKYCKFVNNLDWRHKSYIAGIPEDIRQKTLTKLCNLNDKHESVLNVFIDTVGMYNRLNRENRPNIDIYDIKSYEEIVRLHDTCLELKRLEDEERRRLNDMKEAERHALLEKKMAKLDEERSKFNYSDADFTIRLPEKLSEIVNEGNILRHCVGGYTQSHAEGSTTIMFLRRNSDPTTSFYTIEIRNDNVIQQIHGFGNKWLGNDPDAIPTVMRWLAANNLSCTDEILLSTAKGYCLGNAPLVEKPII